MRNWQYLFFGLLVISCGTDGGGVGGGSSSSSNSYSTIQIQFASDEVSTFSLIRPFNVACTLGIGAGTHSGNCFTPKSIKAKVFRMNLINSFGGAPSRLIDFTAAPEDLPFGGPHGVLGLSEYDFAATAQSTNSYSDDNLQDSGESYYDAINLEVGAIELKLEIPSGNGNVANKFWTIRYMLLPQNPLDDTQINSCVTSTPHRDQITSGGDLYGSPGGFSQGDILICQKALSSDSCTDTDFKWINSATGALSVTRPGSPVKLSGTYAFRDNSCENEGGNLVMGGVNFKTNISPAIRINKSRSAEDCLFKYSFQTNCTTTGLNSGSCSDAAQEGFGINVSIDFDLTNSVFVENTLDLGSDTEVALLQNLHLVLPKPLYIENNKAAVGTGDDTTIDSAITITADNAIANTILQSRNADPNDYDSDYCFIQSETN